MAMVELCAARQERLCPMLPSGLSWGCSSPFLPPWSPAEGAAAPQLPAGWAPCAQTWPGSLEELPMPPTQPWRGRALILLLQETAWGRASVCEVAGRRWQWQQDPQPTPFRSRSTRGAEPAPVLAPECTDGALDASPRKGHCLFWGVSGGTLRAAPPCRALSRPLGLSRASEAKATSSGCPEHRCPCPVGLPHGTEEVTPPAPGDLPVLGRIQPWHPPPPPHRAGRIGPHIRPPAATQSPALGKEGRGRGGGMRGRCLAGTQGHGHHIAGDRATASLGPPAQGWGVAMGAALQPGGVRGGGMRGK